jgi:hypothetical protein
MAPSDLDLTINSSSNSSSLIVPESFFTCHFVNKDELEFDEKLFNIASQITGLYLIPFVCIFGVLGNILNVIIYQQSKKNSIHLYLIALSLSDILKLGNDFLYFIVNILNKIDCTMGENLFKSLYVYSHYIFLFTAINTAWLTCAIAVDRYMSIVQNLNKNVYAVRNYKRSLYVSFFIFFLSAIVSIPSPLFLTLKNQAENSIGNRLARFKLYKIPFKELYNYFNPLVKAYLPLLALVYLDYKIIKCVYEKKMKRRKSSQFKSKSKSSISLMLITIVLTFTVCMFPDAIMTMMQLGYANDTFLVRSIREFTDLLLAINSAVTFLICFYFSIEFRNKLFDLFDSKRESNLRSKSLNEINTIIVCEYKNDNYQKKDKKIDKEETCSLVSSQSNKNAIHLNDV